MNKDRKQQAYLAFMENVAKINIEYLEGRTDATTAMAAVSALISEMSKIMERWN